MIFVTVGHQTPFDRLIKAADKVAGIQPSLQMFAQIGDGQYIPEHMEYVRWLSAPDFEKKIESCTSVVSHAGTGTILQVLELNKSLLVLPRRAALGETRNDHQVGTALYFAEQGTILAAGETEELPALIEQLDTWRPKKGISNCASPRLISRIRKFVAELELE